MKVFKNVFVFDHPLIKHKVAILRDKSTGMKEFRELVEEITTMMTYESMRDVELVPVQVETPLETVTQYKVPDESIAIVPILRAGLGMVNGVHKVFPTARVGHIGMYRNEERSMLFCVVSKKEVVTLKEFIKSIDVHAFVIVTDVREVLGEGFLEY